MKQKCIFIFNTISGKWAFSCDKLVFWLQGSCASCFPLAAAIFSLNLMQECTLQGCLILLFISVHSFIFLDLVHTFTNHQSLLLTQYTVVVLVIMMECLLVRIFLMFVGRRPMGFLGGQPWVFSSKICYYLCIIY